MTRYALVTATLALLLVGAIALVFWSEQDDPLPTGPVLPTGEVRIYP